jgi:hypothetical protein
MEGAVQRGKHTLVMAPLACGLVGLVGRSGGLRGGLG